jgi:hypothetical protein
MSKMAFKLAARKAFKAAMLAGMNVNIPVEYDFNGRRGRIQGMDTKGGLRRVSPITTSMTQGRASEMDYVPQLQQNLAAKAAKTGEEEEEE